MTERNRLICHKHMKQSRRRKNSNYNWKFSRQKKNKQIDVLKNLTIYRKISSLLEEGLHKKCRRFLLMTVNNLVISQKITRGRSRNVILVTGTLAVAIPTLQHPKKLFRYLMQVVTKVDKSIASLARGPSPKSKKT